MRAPEIHVSVTANLFKLQHEICVQKTKYMAFVGKYSLRTKIVLDNKEYRAHVTFPCDVTYHVAYDVNHNLVKFQSICGTIRRALSRKTRKETLPKFCKVMAVSVLLYSSET